MFTVKRSGFATYHWVTLDRRLNLSGPQLLHVQNMPIESQSFSGWLGKGVSERGYTRKYFVNQETYRTVYGGTNCENATISNFKRSDGDGYGYFSSCPHPVPVGHLCSAFAGLNGGFRATHIWFQGSRFLSLVFFSPSLPGPDRPRFVCACPVPLCVGELAALPAALRAILHSPRGPLLSFTVAILLLPPISCCLSGLGPRGQVSLTCHFVSQALLSLSLPLS